MNIVNHISFSTGTIGARRRDFRATKLTLGTPMKIELFSEASRILAATSRRSVILFLVSATEGSERDAKRYRSPTLAGVLAVSNVQVYRHFNGIASSSELWLQGNGDTLQTSCSESTLSACDTEEKGLKRPTESTSHPSSALCLFASPNVLCKTALSFCTDGEGKGCGCLCVKSCLTTGGRCLTMTRIK